jgi:hypothetical protein
MGEHIPNHAHGFGDVPTGTGAGQYPSGTEVAAMIAAAPSSAPFVATNEYYIDLLAAVDAARRIYPSVGAAITVGQAAFPAGTTILCRLREDQEHDWNPVEVGQEYLGTHPLVIYSTRDPKFRRFNPDYTLTVNSPGPAAGGENITFKNLTMFFSAPAFVQDWLSTTLVFEDVVMWGSGATCVIKAQGIWGDVITINGVVFECDSPGAVAGEGLHLQRFEWNSDLWTATGGTPIFNTNANGTFKNGTIQCNSQQWVMFKGTGVANMSLQDISIHAQNGVLAAAAFFSVPGGSINGISDVRVICEDIVGPVTWGLPNGNISGSFLLQWQGSQPADLPTGTWFVSGGAVIPKP